MIRIPSVMVHKWRALSLKRLAHFSELGRSGRWQHDLQQATAWSGVAAKTGRRGHSGNDQIAAVGGDV
jgi:hypothetical protein